MKNNYLKKCPKCHSEAHILIDWNGKKINNAFQQYASCTECGYRTDSFETRDLAIQAWNNDERAAEGQLNLFDYLEVTNAKEI